MLAGLTELEAVLGGAGREVASSIRCRIIEAMAARDRGDSVAMIDALGSAMKDLAAIGDHISPGDGHAMVTLATRFRNSLLRGDLTTAKQSMDVMFDQSGARFQTKKG